SGSQAGGRVIRRGEGGGRWMGGPLWSPVGGDGIVFSQPPSPLRLLMGLFLGQSLLVGLYGRPPSLAPLLNSSYLCSCLNNAWRGLFKIYSRVRTTSSSFRITCS